jgi:hypothetical protein
LPLPTILELQLAPLLLPSCQELHLAHQQLEQRQQETHQQRSPTPLELLELEQRHSLQHQLLEVLLVLEHLQLPFLV